MRATHIVSVFLCSALSVSVMAVPLTPGDLIVADFNRAFGSYSGISPLQSGYILKVDPTSGAQTLISSGGYLDAPYDVAIDAAGDIIVLDKAHPSETGAFGQIVKINPGDGSQTVISQNGLFVNPMGLAIDAAGNIILADQSFGGTGGIIKVDPVSGTQTVVATGGFISTPSDVAIDGAGNLYVTSKPPGTNGLSVVKVDPNSGTQTLVSSNGSSRWYSGIAVDDAATNVYVNELYYLNGVIKVDPISGGQTVLASGYPFQDPYGLDIDLTGDLVIADANWFWAGSIIKVDPSSGAKTLISSGGLLVDPAGIAVYQEPAPGVPEPATLFLLGFGLGGLGFRARKKAN